MWWDRAGAIVALPFDYIQEPETLLKFVFRIAVAFHSGQGYDATASLASPEDIALFSSHVKALEEESWARKRAEAVLNNLCCVRSGQTLQSMCHGNPGFMPVDSTSNLACLYPSILMTKEHTVHFPRSMTRSRPTVGSQSAWAVVIDIRSSWTKSLPRWNWL